MFHTSEEDASDTMRRLGYWNSFTTLQGFSIPQRTRAFFLLGRPIKSSDFLWWMVSGRMKYAPIRAAPARAV